MKERRCNLFDDNGKPRRLKDGTKGCFRDANACRFAHPRERDWKTAHPSFPPKHDAVADSDSEFFYILLHPDRAKDYHDRERDRERIGGRERERKSSSSFLPDSPSHRRDNTTTRGSPGPPSRRSTFDTTMDAGETAKRGRSPALSTASDHLERLRTDKKYRTGDLPPSERSSTSSVSRRSRSPARDKGKVRGLPSLHNKPPPPGSYASNTRNTGISIAQQPSTPALPPEPPKPPPAQPPPPLQIPEVPQVPSFVFNQQPTPSAEDASKRLKELTLDEQRATWHERIDLMFTSITLRRDHAKLESDLSHIHLLSNSVVVDNMPEADRTRINTQKSALESEMMSKRKEVNETIQKLVGSSFWPVLRTPQILEMERAVAEAKKHVLEVKSLSDDVKNSCAALFKTSASDRPQDADRPIKRRKLDGDAGILEPSSGSAGAVSVDTTRELEAFHDKLTELVGHLVSLENEIIQRDQSISEEIDLQITARLEEEDTLYPPVREPAEVSQTEIQAVVDAKNRDLVQAVTTTGEEIGLLAVEVAELITKVDALEARCMALETDKRELKNRIAQDALQHAKSQEAWARREREIEAIVAALQAYISQSSAIQTSSELPSAEYIIESLDSQLQGLLREKYSATLVNMQEQVAQRVEESHKRTLETVSPKIMLLLKMVNLITARLGKADMDAVHAG